MEVNKPQRDVCEILNQPSFFLAPHGQTMLQLLVKNFSAYQAQDNLVSNNNNNNNSITNDYYITNNNTSMSNSAICVENNNIVNNNKTKSNNNGSCRG